MFGDELRRIRKSLGLSQEELAARAQLSTRTIVGLESGVAGRPRGATLRALIRELRDDADAERALTRAWRGGEVPVLPHPPSPIVGRATDVDDLAAALLDPAQRVVTVTGAAGVGKTRVALEAAHRVKHRFERTRFVELAGVRSGEDAQRAIAAAIEPEPDAAMLVVVDNAEHLATAVADALSALVARDGPTLLVTSRVPLGLRAERVRIIAPLPIDDAVALLRARANEAGAPLPADTVSRTAEMQICDRLDRLPLAIELVAPRLRSLGPLELAERLRERLPLLEGGAPDRPERQRSLRAAIAWSYELLTESERAALRGFSVFAGGWSADAADAVLGAGAAVVLERLVVTHLVSSLREPDGRTRFHLLETVAEFAAAMLAREPDERRRLRGTHAQWVLDLSRRALTAPGGHGLAAWGVLDREIENLCAAIEHTTEDGAYELAMRIVVQNGGYWLARGRATQAVRCLDDILAHADREPPVVPVDVLALAYALYANFIPYARGDMRTAVRALERAIVLARAHGDDRTIGRVASALLNAALLTGNEPLAREAGDEAVRHARAAGDRFCEAASENNLGYLDELCGDDAAALLRFRHAERVFDELGEPAYADFARVSIGGIVVRMGAVAEGERLLLGALRAARRRDDALVRAAALRRIAQSARRLERRRAALVAATLALRIDLAVESQLGIARDLEEIALAVSERVPAVAARALAAAERIGAEAGLAHVPRVAATIARATAQVRAALGIVAADVLWAAGRREDPARIAAGAIADFAWSREPVRR